MYACLTIDGQTEFVSKPIKEYSKIVLLSKDDIVTLTSLNFYANYDFENECIVPKSIMEDFNTPDELTLLKAQLQAMTERNEFIEDVIAEMAMEVYKTV